MNLRYINIWLNPRTGYDDDYRYEFLLHTRFISNYFSKQIRKYKFKTDGTFEMISINPMPDGDGECKVVPSNALATQVLFDKKRYEQMRGTTDYDYYLELLEEGFKKVSECKEVPLKTLLDLIETFKENGCKNEWRHKKKQFKEQDIEVILNCYFTTFDFRLVVIINRISTGMELCSGVAIRTEPDEINFSRMFKDVFIEKNIVITDASDFPLISINLRDALNKKFTCKLKGDSELIEALSYSG